MPSWAQQKANLRTAIAAGRRPRFTADGRQIVTLGQGRGSFALLSRADGALTRAGRFYYEETGRQRPNSSFDPNQPLTRHGSTDYITLRNNTTRAVRTLQPTGSFKVTRLGKLFFKEKHSEYIAHVPVIITGTRARGRNAGTTYEREDWLPANVLGAAQVMQNDALSEQDKVRNVKSEVLQQFSVLRTTGGRTVIHEESDETYLLDRNREWKISSQTTQIVNDQVVTQTRMRRPLGVLRGACSQLPFHEQILDEAFEDHDDRLCVPRQLSVLLGMSLQDTSAAFDNICPDGWRERGVTPEEILEFGKFYGCPCFYWASGQMVATYEPEHKLNKAIAFTSWEDHAFVYKNAKNIASLKGKRRETVANDTKRTLPPFAEWQTWGGEFKPGFFMAEDLMAVRRQFLDSGRNPKVSLRNLAEYSQLAYRCCKNRDGEAGVCTIRERPQDCEDILQWLARLPREIEYNGERLPAIALKVFLHLMKAERIYLNATQKEAILKKQDNRCNLCGGIFDGDVEWDHVAALRQSLSGQEQCFQAICCSCHAEKTALESKQDANITSYFNKRAWDSYVQSPRLPPLVFENQSSDRDKPYVGVDCVRCRKNGLANNDFDFPIFCPFDSVRKATAGELADFSFLEIKSRKSAFNTLPGVHGSAWYPKNVVAHLLETRAIDWDDVKFSLQASGHIPRAAFRRALDQMEAAWTEDQAHLAKVSINSMVGLLCKNNAVFYSVKSSMDSLDGVGCHISQFFGWGSKEDWKFIHDFIWTQHVLDNASTRPIHDWVMGHEYVLVAKIRRLCVIDPRYFKQIKTDCVLFQGLAKKSLPLLKKAAEAAKYEDGSPVFRFIGEDEGLKPLMVDCERMPLEARHPEELPGWETIGADDLERHVLGGKSVLITGYPGTGKTYVARKLIGKLRESGKLVEVISKTHVSVQNVGLGAKTADHWTRKHVRNGATSADTLVVEEITQIDVFLWCDIAKLLHKGLQFILLGDFRQFSAICASWSTSPLPDDALKKSDLLFELAGGNRTELTENRRSDPKIFDFIKSLRVDEPDEKHVASAAAEARGVFPTAAGARADFTLVMSHKRRIEINAHCNELDRTGRNGAVEIPMPVAKQVDNNAPQPMWLWPGLRLIGAGHKVPKGIFVEVKACDAETVTLANDLALTHAQVCQSLRLCYAITYASCQGLTLPGRVRLETQSTFLTTRHLYVGISRATSSDLVEVA